MTYSSVFTTAMFTTDPNAHQPKCPSGFLNLGTTGILGWICIVVGAVLCIVGCLTASLASTHYMTVAPPCLQLQVVTTKNIFRYLQMFPWCGGDKIIPPHFMPLLLSTEQWGEKIYCVCNTENESHRHNIEPKKKKKARQKKSTGCLFPYIERTKTGQSNLWH